MMGGAQVTSTRVEGMWAAMRTRMVSPFGRDLGCIKPDANPVIAASFDDAVALTGLWIEGASSPRHRQISGGGRHAKFVGELHLGGNDALDQRALVALPVRRLLIHLCYEACRVEERTIVGDLQCTKACGIPGLFPVW
jgi:hypothetical protein